MTESALSVANALRGALREWVADYCRRRSLPGAGEFLDQEGSVNTQFGISGTCFVTAMEEAERLRPAKFAGTWQLIADALAKPEKDRSNFERHLLKDVPRVPGKAITLALGPERIVDLAPVVCAAFASRGPNGLIKPVLDDPAADGDPIVTALVMLMLRFGGRDASFMTEIHSVIPELCRQRDEASLSLNERLLVSTALCVYVYSDAISPHRTLLGELYSLDDDWTRSFASDSPFLDHRYGDAPRNRYLRVPEAFVILSAIYLTIGDEGRFFAFPPVRSMLTQIRRPFVAHVDRDRNKATAYFAWFTYVALHPSRYYRTAEQSGLAVAAARLGYWTRDLTALGLIVLSVCLFASACATWFAYDSLANGASGELDKFVGSVGTALTAALGLFRTRKR